MRFAIQRPHKIVAQKIRILTKGDRIASVLIFDVPLCLKTMKKDYEKFIFE